MGKTIPIDKLAIILFAFRVFLLFLVLVLEASANDKFDKLPKLLTVIPASESIASNTDLYEILNMANSMLASSVSSSQQLHNIVVRKPIYYDFRDKSNPLGEPPEIIGLLMHSRKGSDMGFFTSSSVGAMQVRIDQVVRMFKELGLPKTYSGTIDCHVCESAASDPSFPKHNFVSSLSTQLFEAGYENLQVVGYLGKIYSNPLNISSLRSMYNGLLRLDQANLPSKIQFEELVQSVDKVQFWSQTQVDNMMVFRSRELDARTYINGSLQPTPVIANVKVSNTELTGNRSGRQVQNLRTEMQELQDQLDRLDNGCCSLM